MINIIVSVLVREIVSSVGAMPHIESMKSLACGGIQHARPAPQFCFSCQLRPAFWADIMYLIFGLPYGCQHIQSISQWDVNACVSAWHRRIQEFETCGPYGERGALAYNGVWGICPQGGPGAKPLVSGSGKLLMGAMTGLSPRSASGAWQQRGWYRPILCSLLVASRSFTSQSVRPLLASCQAWSNWLSQGSPSKTTVYPRRRRGNSGLTRFRTGLRLAKAVN